MREEIVDAGIALIDRSNDPTTLTLRGVAREVGITAMSIYPHFDTVQTMVDAILQRSFSQLASAVSSAVETEGEASSALIAGCVAYVQFGWDQPARYRLMFAAGGFAPNAVETFAIIEDALTRCVRLGVSRSDDPHRDTFLLWAGLHGIATLEKPARPDYRRLGALDRPAAIRLIVQRLAVLTVPPPPSSHPTGGSRRRRGGGVHPGKPAVADDQ